MVKMHRLLLTLWASPLVAVCAPALCAGISVGQGASLKLNNSSVDLNCLDVNILGELNLGSGQLVAIDQLSISGVGDFLGGSGTVQFHRNWQNAGTFSPGTSVVALLDGCGAALSEITGDNDFSSFNAVTAAGKTLRIEAGSLQTFSANLRLEGVAPDQRLTIRSTIDGSQSHFVLFEQASQQINAVDVKDNDASPGAPIAPGPVALYASVDSGNNKNWFQQLLDVIFKDGFETAGP